MLLIGIKRSRKRRAEYGHPHSQELGKIFFSDENINKHASASDLLANLGDRNPDVMAKRKKFIIDKAKKDSKFRKELEIEIDKVYDRQIQEISKTIQVIVREDMIDLIKEESSKGKSDEEIAEMIKEMVKKEVEWRYRSTLELELAKAIGYKDPEADLDSYLMILTNDKLLLNSIKLYKEI